MINFNIITRNYCLNKTTLIFCCSVSFVSQYIITVKPIYTDSETINPYLPSGICHPYQLDESTCHLKVVRYLVSFSFYFEDDFLLANSVDPDRTPSSVAS